jgi:uncharacterized membrane protein
MPLSDTIVDVDLVLLVDLVVVVDLSVLPAKAAARLIIRAVLGRPRLRNFRIR